MRRTKGFAFALVLAVTIVLSAAPLKSQTCGYWGTYPCEVPGACADGCREDLIFYKCDDGTYQWALGNCCICT